MLFDRKYELNVLINLAALDHIIESKESKLIHIIGKANQLAVAEIDEMIKRPEPIQGFRAMTQDEKFSHLCYLIRMMKADGQVIRNEIEFCETIAERLGYRKGVVREMSAHIYADMPSDIELLRKKSDRFIKS
ncbi:MAG: hypothetical protein RI909_401, partial [Bacteroidota bacterium]